MDAHNRTQRSVAAMHALASLRFYEASFPGHAAPIKAVAGMIAYCNGDADIDAAIKYNLEIEGVRDKIQMFISALEIKTGHLVAAREALDAVLAAIDPGEPQPDLARRHFIFAKQAAESYRP